MAPGRGLRDFRPVLSDGFPVVERGGEGVLVAGSKSM